MKESESKRGPTDATLAFNFNLDDRSSLDNVSTCKLKCFGILQKKKQKVKCACVY